MEIKGYADCIFKAEGDDDDTISGYASNWNESDQEGDVIMPGAFAKGLTNGRRVKMLWQHDAKSPIGTWTDIQEDEKGLRVKGKFLANTWGNDAKIAVKAGAVDGLSIRATINDFEYQGNRRLIKACTLKEISVVTFPCLESAMIDMRKAEQMTIREIEKHLRDSGFSRAVSEKLLAGGYAALIEKQWDAVKQLDDNTKLNGDAETIALLNTIMNKL